MSDQEPIRYDHVGTDCPTCGAHLDASRDAGGMCRAPQPGDLTLCAYCTSFLVYGEGLKLRLMTLEEVAELEDGVRNAMVQWRRQLREGKRLAS